MFDAFKEQPLLASADLEAGFRVRSNEAAASPAQGRIDDASWIYMAMACAWMCGKGGAGTAAAAADHARQTTLQQFALCRVR